MASDFAAKNRAAYDEIAGRFVERNSGTLPYILEAGEWVLGAVQSAGLQERPILDLGCGAGRDMAWFESRGALVVGGDLSTGMLAEARRAVQGPLCQLDMRFLPFAAQSFAAVWCQAALLHLPKHLAPAALAEVRRVLLPGGAAHIAVQQGDSEGFETRPYEPVERYYAHYQPEELAALVRDAGFQIMRQGTAEARRRWLYLGAVYPPEESKHGC